MEWISVEDELPENPQGCRFSNYLAIHVEQDKEARLLMFDSENGCFTKEYVDVQKVTHWMLLPKLPQD